MKVGTMADCSIEHWGSQKVELMDFVMVVRLENSKAVWMVCRWVDQMVVY